MSETEHKLIQEQILAYALNSLEADEAAGVTRHLSGCATCRAELRAYEAVVDAMAFAAPDAEPSATLKERLMSRLKDEPESLYVSLPAEHGAQIGWVKQLGEAFRNLLAGPRWRPIALAAIVTLVIINVFLLLSSLPDSNSWRRVRLAGTEIAPEASGIIYISADGNSGTLIVDRLPPLGADQQYQLWLIRNGERASGAVFSVNEQGYRGLEIESALPLKDYESFGITIEPSGGSPGPTGQRVLGYNL